MLDHDRISSEGLSPDTKQSLEKHQLRASTSVQQELTLNIGFFLKLRKPGGAIMNGSRPADPRLKKRSSVWVPQTELKSVGASSSDEVATTG